jgi:hypothetical protein
MKCGGGIVGWGPPRGRACPCRTPGLRALASPPPPGACDLQWREDKLDRIKRIRQRRRGKSEQGSGSGSISGL